MDVRATAHWGAVPADSEEAPGRRCGALTAARSAWAAWLQQCPSETVGLESTGVSGMTLFAGLAERGCAVKLVDAPDARQGPGRTTDVQDGPWLQELHTSGV